MLNTSDSTIDRNTKIKKEEHQMEQIFILEDFNGVDGGTLTLHRWGKQFVDDNR